MNTILHKHRSEYKLLCKGDNLRIFLVVPDHLLEKRSIKEVTNEVMNSLVKGLGDVGHTMKPLDFRNLGKRPK